MGPGGHHPPGPTPTTTADPEHPEGPEVLKVLKVLKGAGGREVASCFEVARGSAEMTMTDTDTVPAETATDPRRVKKGQFRAARGLLAPAVLFLVLLTQIPFLVTIGFSLVKWNLLYPQDRGFTGLDNYATALTSGALGPSILATVLITALSVILSVLFGLLFAL